MFLNLLPKILFYFFASEIKLNPQQAKENYLTRMNTYINDLKNKCGQYKINFIQADIAEGFDKMLYAYLLKRATML